jgi:hypothetical protein
MGRGERLGAVAVACTAHALRGSSRADVWQGRRGVTEVVSLSGALREATHPPPLTLSNGRRDGLASAGERWDAVLDSLVQSGKVVGLGALLLELPVLAVPAMVGPVSNHLSEREAQTISPYSRSILKPDSIMTFLCASSFFCSAVTVSSSTRSSA